MNVLICDDSAFMRRWLQQLIAVDPELRVIDAARNGDEALSKARELRPDLVVLDLEMPVMDGLTALRRIRRECEDPPAVLVSAGLTPESSRKALNAMRLGAADFIIRQTTPGASDAVGVEVLAKLKAIGHTRRAQLGVVRTFKPSFGGAAADLRHRPFDLIAIGASSGGPAVLEKILAAIPNSLRAPVVIAQHMPAMFTQSLAARIGEQSKVPVRHVAREMLLEPGTVHVVQGGRHGQVRRTPQGLILSISDEASCGASNASFAKPSVDELFTSAAGAAGQRCLAIVLSGIGEDGVRGCGALRAAGAAVVAQELSSCVAQAMPRAIIERSLATAVMNPDEISGLLVSIASGFGAAPMQALPPAA